MIEESAYLPLPLYQELQQKIDVSDLKLNDMIKLKGIYFKVPSSLNEKLKQNNIDDPISINALQRFAEQAPLEDYETERFSAPSHLEAELLKYYLEVLQAADVIESLNKKNNNLFTEKSLRTLFDLGDDVEVFVYFAKESDDPLPDDCVFIKFSQLEDSDIDAIKNNINSRIDYQCNSINHQGSLEIYGVMSHIIRRLEDLRK